MSDMHDDDYSEQTADEQDETADEFMRRSLGIPDDEEMVGAFTIPLGPDDTIDLERLAELIKEKVGSLRVPVTAREMTETIAAIMVGDEWFLAARTWVAMGWHPGDPTRQMWVIERPDAKVGQQPATSNWLFFPGQFMSVEEDQVQAVSTKVMPRFLTEILEQQAQDEAGDP